MSGQVDQRLGLSAQFEQADHGWERVARGRSGQRRVLAGRATRGFGADRSIGRAPHDREDVSHRSARVDRRSRCAGGIGRANDGADVDAATFRARGNALFGGGRCCSSTTRVCESGAGRVDSAAAPPLTVDPPRLACYGSAVERGRSTREPETMWSLIRRNPALRRIVIYQLLSGLQVGTFGLLLNLYLLSLGHRGRT